MHFERFTSLALRVPRKDIDTDLIIPARYLRVTSRDGMAEGCFAELRKDPDFPMNLPENRHAAILVAGENFGCGSSREHAVWAMHAWGFRVVIAPSFADIFRGNAEKNGLLPVALAEDAVARLLQSTQDITVDLQNQLVECGEESWTFEISAFSKRRLLENLSDLDMLREHGAAITTLSAARPSAAAGLAVAASSSS